MRESGGVRDCESGRESWEREGGICFLIWYQRGVDGLFGDGMLGSAAAEADPFTRPPCGVLATVLSSRTDARPWTKADSHEGEARMGPQSSLASQRDELSPV